MVLYFIVDVDFANNQFQRVSNLNYTCFSHSLGKLSTPL